VRCVAQGKASTGQAALARASAARNGTRWTEDNLRVVRHDIVSQNQVTFKFLKKDGPTATHAEPKTAPTTTRKRVGLWVERTAR
jgi:hypothetical protein